MMNQNSFLSIAQNHKRLRCEKFLDEMEKVVPWNDFQNEIKPYYTEKETGRKRMDLVMMLKIYFLQQWYCLSDREAEEMIYDRNSFQKFLGIDLLSQLAPDDTIMVPQNRTEKWGRLRENFNPKNLCQKVYENNTMECSN